MSPLRRLAEALAAFLIAAALPLSAQSPGVTAESLPMLLEQAAAAYGEGRLADAADLLARAERDFGQEPEFADRDLLRRVLLLRGYAEAGAGRPAEAAEIFERFLEQFPRDPEAPAVLHALATALARERPEEAIRLFARFAQDYPNRPETALAGLTKADLLLQTGHTAEAVEVWEALSTNPVHPALFRSHARLRAVRQTLENESADIWKPLLLNYDWPVKSMPEIASLTWSALRAGDRLMEAGDGSGAVRALRLALPRSVLLEMHQERARELNASLRRGRAIGGDPRLAFARNLLENLTLQTGQLESADDHTPHLVLRRAQAYLLAGRPREAWLLCESLALDEVQEPVVRQEAHYRWILAASELEKWEEALAIARNYLARHPESELAPQAFSLIAQAHQEQRRHPEAIEVLSDLILSFPDHPLRPRWLFTRGFNRASLDEFPAAGRDFHAALETGSGTLAETAALWTGMILCLERRYDEALERFVELAAEYGGRPVEAEILFRRASTLYAMREHKKAEAAVAAYLERFPRHQRQAEALVLLGDIRMGAGALDRAMETFAALPRAAGHLYLYGLFQRGKILRALEEYEAMIELFDGHLADPELTAADRVSEALYWSGWAHTQLDRPERALRQFEEALERFGNEPEAAEIGSLLTALEVQRRRVNGQPFTDWLESERSRALEAGRLTYFSRLSLRLAEKLEQEGRPRQAEALLFDLLDQVPEEKLDPAGLARLGRLLQEKQLGDGKPLLTRLLREFPRAPERGAARLALARWHRDRGETGEALRWIRRFLQETPNDPEAGAAMLLHAELLRETNQIEAAVAQYEEILRLRSLRGRTHAAALTGMAETWEEAGEPGKAIAAYQRLYTLYRAFPDLVAAAYLRSGKLFEEIGDPSAAFRTYRELMEDVNLQNLPAAATARERAGKLREEVGDDESNPL